MHFPFVARVHLIRILLFSSVFHSFSFTFFCGIEHRFGPRDKGKKRERNRICTASPAHYSILPLSVHVCVCVYACCILYHKPPYLERTQDVGTPRTAELSPFLSLLPLTLLLHGAFY